MKDKSFSILDKEIIGDLKIKVARLTDERDVLQRAITDLEIQVIDRGASYEKLHTSLLETIDEMNRIHKLKTVLHVTSDKRIAELEAKVLELSQWNTTEAE